jgi:hypothetical protein
MLPAISKYLKMRSQLMKKILRRKMKTWLIIEIM